MKKIIIKRIYEDAKKSDGYRILVDRIWPRGITKKKAKLDEWNKNLAPSTELRKWFNHQEERFKIFEKDYLKELKEQKEELTRLVKITNKQLVCLIYSAKDTAHNQAVVLEKLLNEMQNNK